MADNITDQLWYRGQELRKDGTIFLGFIVDAQDKTGARRFQVRIPALHGYCDLDDKNCESENVTKKAALPWAETLASDSAVSLITNNDPPSYHKGDFVLIKFKSYTNLTNPVIISRTTPPNPILGKKEKFSQVGPLITASLVKELGENKSVTQANNGCFDVVVAADERSSNGTNVQGADKCGEAGRIKDGFAANIADFMKIIQDTDGKVGSRFVSKYTGELFEITGYISSYVSNLAGIFRSGIGWIKAIITKYTRKAIDALVKAILQPVKGITKVVSDTLQKLLNMIACSFGDLDKFIENLLESLLNSLIDGALNAVFSCLDSLVDGILNEILSEALDLINTIMSSISAIAGLIGSFGDLIGEAINAILDFLGISCGGADNCTVSAQKSFIAKFNTPGEYGFPTGIKRALANGANSLNDISTAIDNNSTEARAAGDAAKAGVELGTSKVPEIGSPNSSLSNAVSTASTIIGDSIIGFCDNMLDEQNTTDSTTAAIVGSVDNTYDATYSVIVQGDVVDTGGTHTFAITRNNDLSAGVINFVAYLERGDTARVVGITPGLSTSGDLNKDVSLSSADYATDINNSGRLLPVAGNVIVSKKIEFAKGEKKKNITIKTNTNTPLSDTIDEVRYTVGIFRSSDDLNNINYPGKNLPNTSSVLNTNTARIKFIIPEVTVSGTTPNTPPTISTINLTYRSQDVSITAGSNAIFTITRTPVDSSYSRIKCQTINNSAESGVHFEGGEALIEFQPQQASATFAVKTTTISGLTNTAKQFNIKIVDETVPSGLTTNLGGSGLSTGTSIGSGITYTGTINYNVFTGVVPVCPPQLVITSPPPTCIIHPDIIPLSIGVIAKTTIAGYTLSYQWQRTYVPSSGWFDIGNGTFSTNIDVKETVFQQLDSATISGISVPISGWTTSVVSKPASTSYSGANTSTIVINPPSYLINDEEYYRCIITATPSVITSGTPILSGVTVPTYIGITSSGVFLTSVNCSPVTPSGGVVIVYSGTTPTPGGVTTTAAGLCVTPVFPIPAVPSGITPPTISGVTPPIVPPVIPVVPSGIRIIPVEDESDDTIPTIPVVVDPNGGVVSVPTPPNLPRYKYPPLIPIIGAGIGATARAELDSDGILTRIIVKNKGIGYSPSTTSKNLCGILESISITNVGGFYESSPTVYVDGDSSIAFAAIENSRVVQIRITNPQNKVYTTIPRIDIIGGDGLGASGIAVLKYVDCATIADEYLNIVDKYNTKTIGTTRIVDCP